MALLARAQVAVVVIVLRWYPETAHRELEDLNPEDADRSIRDGVRLASTRWPSGHPEEADMGYGLAAYDLDLVSWRSATRAVYRSPPTLLVRARHRPGVVGPAHGVVRVAAPSCGPAYLPCARVRRNRRAGREPRPEPGDNVDLSLLGAEGG